MCLAVVGRVESTDGHGVTRTAVVEVGGARRDVTLTFCPEARVGDWVTVHSGHAIAVTAPDLAEEIVAFSHDVG
ncbi:MAG TPA: HypC/HybG/HupF family hydrogenase formation chaperone [Acidimicrobiia bacterium]|nr:HypC/HybG/HupF family hydrogenase formation chaperone [Acidimicrobiia bacterium]